MRGVGASLRLAVIMLVTAAGLVGCKDTNPNYTCRLRLAKPPEAVTIEDERWVRAIVETECDADKPPRSHNLTLWLERQDAAGHWRMIKIADFTRVPGSEPRKNVVAYAGCQDGRWRLRVVVSGRSATGVEYVSRPGPFENDVECGP